jgi:hypothetical protein
MRSLLARALHKARPPFLLEPPDPQGVENNDEYINRYSMEYGVSRLPSDSPLLVIGSFCGLSTNVLTYYKRKHAKNNRLITCDKWEFERKHPADCLGNSIISSL